MSTLEVNKITPSTGTSITLGDSGDTFTIPSGVTLANNGNASGFGKLAQITQGTKSTRVRTTSTSATATGILTSITPSATNSKIYLMINLGGCRMATNTYMSLWLYRQINGGGYVELRKFENGMGYINGSSWQTWGKAQNYLDTTHNTTDQIDYQVYFSYNGSGSQVDINTDEQEWSTITAMEVLA